MIEFSEKQVIKIEGTKSQILTELHMLVVESIKRIEENDETRINTLNRFIEGLRLFGSESFK